MKRFILFGILGVFILTACGINIWERVPAFPMMNNTRRWGLGNYSSIGERIYFTGTNDRGNRIPYTDGPAFGGGMMMGDSLSCASCHGPDGRGGTQFLHMEVIDAPEIRFEALSEEMEEQAEDGHSHEDDHGEYDLEAFRMAVVEGLHPDGNPLSSDMPRWRMSDEDLEALLEFIKSIP
jgi:hypothetical protein